MTILNIYNLKGQKSGTFKLNEAFDEKPNLGLLAQAVHVWRSNQRRGLAKAMTRGESGRTTAKVYRQKHTGRARHGSRSAPIFVGGGVAHGPTGEQSYRRILSKKMGQRALVSALLAKANQEGILVVSGLEKLAPKVKAAETLFKALGLMGKKILIAPEKKEINLSRATGNLTEVTVTPVGDLNAYQVLASEALIFTPGSAQLRLGALGKKGKK